MNHEEEYSAKMTRVTEIECDLCHIVKTPKEFDQMEKGDSQDLVWSSDSTVELRFSRSDRWDLYENECLKLDLCPICLCRLVMFLRSEGVTRKWKDSGRDMEDHDTQFMRFWANFIHQKEEKKDA